MKHDNKELLNKDSELNSLRLRLKVLERVTEVASSIEDFGKVLSRLLDLAVEITSTEAGSILLREGNFVVIKASEGPKAGLLKDLKLPLGAGIAGWVAKTE